VGGAPVVVRAPEAGSANSLLGAGREAWVRFPPDTAVLGADDDAEPPPQATEPSVESVPVRGTT
jgi:hypothetical protein